jgi:hypothetical protein
MGGQESPFVAGDVPFLRLRPSCLARPLPRVRHGGRGQVVASSASPCSKAQATGGWHRYGVPCPTLAWACLNSPQALSPAEAHRRRPIREGGGENYRDSRFLAPPPRAPPPPPPLSFLSSPLTQRRKTEAGSIHTGGASEAERLGGWVIGSGLCLLRGEGGKEDGWRVGAGGRREENLGVPDGVFPPPSCIAEFRKFGGSGTLRRSRPVRTYQSSMLSRGETPVMLAFFVVTVVLDSHDGWAQHQNGRRP